MKRLFCFITILAFIATLNLGIRAHPEDRVNRDGNDITYSHWKGETWKVVQHGLDSEDKLSTHTSSTAAKLPYSHFLYAYTSFTSGYEYKISGTYQLHARIKTHNPDGEPFKEGGKIVGKQGGMKRDGDHEDLNWFSNADPRVTFHAVSAMVITEVTHPSSGNKYESNAITPDDSGNVYRVEEKRGDSGNDENGDTDTPTLGITLANSGQTFQPGDSLTLDIVTADPFYNISWYVHTPGDTSSSGTYQYDNYGDGTATSGSFYYTIPSGAMHTGDYLFRALVYRWSDMFYVGEETYTVTVQ